MLSVSNHQRFFYRLAFAWTMICALEIEKLTLRVAILGRGVSPGTVDAHTKLMHPTNITAGDCARLGDDFDQDAVIRV